MRPKVLMGALLGVVMLSACGTVPANDASEAVDNEPLPEVQVVEVPEWPNPSTQVLEELASSCGIYAQKVGAYRVALENDEQGLPFATLRVDGGLEVDDLDLLDCLLENSGANLSMADFPVGGPHEREPHRWDDQKGASWSVHGAKASLLAGLVFTYVGNG